MITWLSISRDISCWKRIMLQSITSIQS